MKIHSLNSQIIIDNAEELTKLNIKLSYIDDLIKDLKI